MIWQFDKNWLLFLAAVIVQVIVKNLLSIKLNLCLMEIIFNKKLDLN